MASTSSVLYLSFTWDLVLILVVIAAAIAAVTIVVGYLHLQGFHLLNCIDCSIFLYLVLDSIIIGVIPFHYSHLLFSDYLILATFHQGLVYDPASLGPPFSWVDARLRLPPAYPCQNARHRHFRLILSLRCHIFSKMNKV